MLALNLLFKATMFALLFILILGDKGEKESIIKDVGSNYIESMERMGIQCPEVVAAQIVLETCYLTSKIYKQNNNMFGMKESSRNWDIGSQHGHAKYIDRAHSILDYRQWQIERSKGKIFKSNEEYIYFLGHLFKREDGTWARYATDPHYEEKLRNIIAKFR